MKHRIYDVVLVGGGIMSATLGRMLKYLNPNFKILILESASELATESSGAWNNAGTGHAGLCELNYTPEENGEINISKALHITEQFEVSKQFWNYFVVRENLDPKDFIHRVPHMSFVKGDDVSFLKRRVDLMTKHHFYKDMLFFRYKDTIKHLVPLIGVGLNGRAALSSFRNGTDVDYGSLTKMLISSLENDGVEILYNSKVKDIYSNITKTWRIEFNNNVVDTKFCFIGAGGASLLLLEKTGIPESKGYGGFPISGQWLVCKNKKVIREHAAKVYGKASVGAPPMSVPHLDTRIINGEKQLLFGPFAGFNTKFLKNGSYFDLFKSIKISNLWAMIKAGLNNMSLNKYLIKEVTASFDKKFAELKAFYPNAKKEDWELITAGQRVQIIKKDKIKGGILQFGTEVITSEDGSIAALLGASPGASTSVSIMIELIEKCFPQMQTEDWIENMTEMIPSYGQSLINNQSLYETINQITNKGLKIE